MVSAYARTSSLMLYVVLALLLILYTGTISCRESSNLCEDRHSNSKINVLEKIPTTGASEHVFNLRHAFSRSLINDSTPLYMLNASNYAVIIAETQSGKLEAPNSLEIRSQQMSVQKPLPAARSSALGIGSSHIESSQWFIDQVVGPNVTDKTTVINLAKMTSDAYYIDPSQPGWFNTSMGFNHSTNFGWDNDGLRGHVFADATNETVIIAFKGTSIDPRDGWSSNDKLNDNLLFSCCCASQRPDPYWYRQVCDCRTDTYKCNSTCLTQEVISRDRYYVTAIEVYQNVTMMYPNAQIWTTGHSMGGAMASLIGLTFNVPAITFESLPQRLPAERLGLQVAPNPRLTGAYHFGHSADPVFMGACNGYFSSCSIYGLAFESQCFTGMRCEYDTVGDKGWRMSINTHRINKVIPNVLEAYDTVAKCTSDEECGECNDWYFDIDPKPLASNLSTHAA